MKKLIILPGATNVLGGTLVTLGLLLQGISQCQAASQVRVLAPAGSFLEEYLRTKGQGEYLELIAAETETEFCRQSLRWVSQQPQDWALLMDNCVAKELMSALVPGSIALRLSKRPVYFFFHDLALTNNPVGFAIRKFIFATLNPATMCNSQFTAGHIKRFAQDLRGVLYQPVDLARFNPKAIATPPPGLEGIIASGAQIMLTPSRLNKPGIVNDKNLRALIPVIAALKQLGLNYHGVIIGDDTSADGSHRRDLEQQAAELGVSDRLTILPPTLEVESYYKCAAVVVTLAPREPFGRTVVEAIACGVPVIGSSSGGIGEILSHFAPQWRVEPNQPQEVARAIAEVAQADNTPQLLEQGIAWVNQRCSPIDYAKRMLKIVDIKPV
ncbi:MAG: glycosyltransferase family 4 protein [Cyanobacteria bacterium P01_C01_bin.72]